MFKTMAKAHFCTSKHNHLSISQLCEEDHEVTFTKKKSKVKNKENQVILTSSRMIDVYIINKNSSSKSICFMSKASSNVNSLWHKCVSHLNFKTLNRLSTNQLVTSFPDHTFAKESFCLACEKGM